MHVAAGGFRDGVRISFEEANPQLNTVYGVIRALTSVNDRLECHLTFDSSQLREHAS